MAGKLTEGSPCPVCGSLHHPAPAALSESAVTQEAVERAKQERDEAEQKSRRIAGESAGLVESCRQKRLSIEQELGALMREEAGAASEGNTAVEPVRDFAATDAASAAVPERYSAAGEDVTVSDVRGKEALSEEAFGERVTAWGQEAYSACKENIRKAQTRLKEARQAGTLLEAEEAGADPDGRETGKGGSAEGGSGPPAAGNAGEACRGEERAGADQKTPSRADRGRGAGRACPSDRGKESGWRKDFLRQRSAKTPCFSRKRSRRARCRRRKKTRNGLRRPWKRRPSPGKTAGRSRALTTEEACLQARASAADMEAWKRTRAAYDQELLRSRERTAQLEKQLAGQERTAAEALQALADSRETCRQEREKLEADSGQLAAVWGRNRKALENLKRLWKGQETQEKEYRLLRHLFQTANGRLSGTAGLDFQTWVQRQYFQRMIQAANRRLNVMADGQFLLQCRSLDALGKQGEVGLDLDVYSMVTGKVRDVKTLSGGESFLTALAMALGMADVIQSTAGYVQIDAMFIDEGFGSLDEESRMRAIRILQDLAGGKRLIGIISHVQELKGSDRPEADREKG